MNRNDVFALLAGVLSFFFAGATLAGADVAELQTEWAVANYELSGEQQEKAFEALIQKADAATSEDPGSAGLWIWNGIIKSSYAGVKGGMGALSLAKSARKSLETAIDIDDLALNGSAYTSLGTLYFRVPGWPLGFGSDKKASKMLETAIQIDPDGIDSNYFYASFLQDQKQYEEALRYYRKAQEAPPRPDRPLADAGRQEEILLAMAQVQERLDR